MSGTPPPDGLSELIGKIIVDDDFYNAIVNDPDGTLQNVPLSQGDKDVVKRVLRDRRQEIDKARRDYQQNPAICAIVVQFPPPTS
jgi:hypothetical protein